MNKENVLKALKELKEKEKKRNFKQTFDLIFTFKNLDLKKPDNQLDFFVKLHHSKGKKIKTCALVGPELAGNAKENCDTVVVVDDFEKYSRDKKLLKKLSEGHDYFIAQATIMNQVATAFGKVLGPKGKMPNPKSGCVVPPNANLKYLIDKLQKMIKISVKNFPMTQLIVGKEDMLDEEIADNIMTIYDSIIHHLPGGKAQIKNILLKFTMSKPIKLD